MTSATAAPSTPTRNAHAAHGRLARLRERAEWGDVLVFIYLLVFARQCLWPLDSTSVSNAAAWALSVPLAAAAWFFYVKSKPFPAERAGREFWLVVLPPLVFFFLLRLPFPDASYDVLNYRMLHAERSLRGTLYAAGDFFPTPAPYNPAPDTVTGLFRLALGYRLGTVVNLLALALAARVVDKLLRPFVAGAWARAACVLLVVLAEHLLFEVNNYMVDLLALPLLLEATWLALGADEAETLHTRRTIFVHAALLLGLASALKLTNAAAVLAVVLLCAYKALAGPRRLKLRELPATVALCFAAFAAPLVPFAVYLWRLTGNPLFPLANGLFKSPFWPTGGGWDDRWGPHGLWETLVWPVLAFFEPARHSELAVYSGRVTLGFVVALCGLALARRDGRVRVLCLVLLTGCLAWGAGGMGYSRYGLYLELLSGVVVVAVAARLFKTKSWRTATAALFVAALCAQAAAACVYAARYEWSMRPTALSDWDSYRYEARYIFRDRRLRDFASGETRALLDGVGAWIDTGSKANAFESLYKPDAPVLGVNHHEYFTTRPARQRFVRALGDAPAPLYSLCMPEDLAEARRHLESHRLAAGRVTPVRLPFFSQRRAVGMMLVEVLRPEGDAGRAEMENFWKSAPYPDYEYRAEITAHDAPATMRAGARAVLRFRVRNAGGFAWPARGDGEVTHQVNLGDRWLDPSTGRVVNDLDGRTALAEDLPPGAEVEMTLPVRAPDAPGVYVLEIDMIHEAVTFFREKGSAVLRLNVRVEP
ncbi:MAG TPA: hypothetical protein VF588_15105 [Pyrinomonadaceae bacterium]|jgi:hypothetical protein